MTEHLTNARPLSDFAALTEAPVAGSVPRFEIGEWRRQLGVVAGITGRGSEPEPFDLGLWSATPVRSAMERWRRFRRAQPEFPGLVLGMQMHGVELRWHEAVDGWLLVEGVDGHGTDRSGILLTVTVADCVPVYLVDPVRRRIALLHAGWRGAASGILGAGVELLRSRGSRPQDLAMHCGVAICGRCYEVGPEVFEACGQPPPDGRGSARIDLRAVLVGQGRGLGIGNISTSELCSAHDSALFFSHRASGGADGRMVAYLGILP